MASVNLSILIGNIGQDAEIKQTRNGRAMASMAIATENIYTDSNGQKHQQTDWHRVVLWGSMAEKLGPHLKAGQRVYVEGSSHTRVFHGENGKKVVTEVKARRVALIGSVRQAPGQGAEGDDSADLSW